MKNIKCRQGTQSSRQKALLESGWLHVLHSLGSGADDDYRGRAEAQEMLGKGEATAECHTLALLYFSIQSVMFIQGIKSICPSHSSFYSFYLLHSFLLFQYFLSLSLTIFDLSCFLYSFPFPFSFSNSLTFSSFPFSSLPFSYCQMAFPKVYTNLHLQQHL